MLLPELHQLYLPLLKLLHPMLHWLKQKDQKQNIATTKYVGHMRVNMVQDTIPDSGLWDECWRTNCYPSVHAKTYNGLTEPKAFLVWWRGNGAIPEMTEIFLYWQTLIPVNLFLSLCLSLSIYKVVIIVLTRVCKMSQHERVQRQTMKDYFIFLWKTGWEVQLKPSPVFLPCVSFTPEHQGTITRATTVLQVKNSVLDNKLSTSLFFFFF